MTIKVNFKFSLNIIQIMFPLPLPISISGLIILIAILYGIWLLIQMANLSAKISNMSTGTMFLIVKIILVAILIVILLQYY